MRRRVRAWRWPAQAMRVQAVEVAAGILLHGALPAARPWSGVAHRSAWSSKKNRCLVSERVTGRHCAAHSGRLAKLLPSKEAGRLDRRPAADAGLAARADLFARSRSRFFNHGGDFFWPRNVDRVAGLDFGDLRAGALVHEAFQFGIDGVVFGGDDRPGRLDLPGGVADLLAEIGAIGQHLRDGHEV